MPESVIAITGRGIVVSVLVLDMILDMILDI